MARRSVDVDNFLEPIKCRPTGVIFHMFTAIALLALAIVTVLFLLVLFEPPLRYRAAPIDASLDSPDFLRVVGGLCDAAILCHGGLQLLSDGNTFYESELAAIARGTKHIHVEAFIFHPSAIGDRFITILSERARQGVRVRVVVDAVGSFPTPDRYFDPLREAGGHVAWYQPLQLSTLKRFNNRTHREVIVVDGVMGFIGGAGIASHWDTGEKGRPPWRDMMFRVTGDLVAGLQTTFAENWLESSGEILADVENFPPAAPGPRQPCGMVVISSPTAGRSTRNRILFQTLIASSVSRIDIHSPYFLPDRSAMDELAKACGRGVKVQVVVPGRFNNHLMTRLASRRRYGRLLKSGVQIHEYQPGMIHTKAMTVDGLWVVVGSTNFDSRSFVLNDEVNLATPDRELAAGLMREFESDLTRSVRITWDAWQRRPLLERFGAALSRLIERQE